MRPVLVHVHLKQNIFLVALVSSQVQIFIIEPSKSSCSVLIWVVQMQILLFLFYTTYILGIGIDENWKLNLLDIILFL